LEIKIIQNDLFFRELSNRIADGERVRIRAKGNSMLPFIRDGKDEIVLEKTSYNSFQKGRLLLIKMPNENYILHRVKKISGNNILLNGDGNLLLFENCSRENAIAEATEVIRNGKSIKVGHFHWELYRLLWPKNYLLRRLGLALYRRIPFLNK